MYNKQFKVGDIAVCTLGSEKGTEFIIRLVIEDGYSCQRVDKANDRYYFYTDRTLVKQGQTL